MARGLMKHQSKQKQVKKALAATKKNPGMVAAAKEKQCALQCPTCRSMLSDKVVARKHFAAKHPKLDMPADFNDE